MQMVVSVACYIALLKQDRRWTYKIQIGCVCVCVTQSDHIEVLVF